MNDIFSTVGLKGEWIVQSANYSLLLQLNYKNSFVNRIQWKHVKKNKLYLKLISHYLRKQDKLSNASIYCVESIDNKIKNVSYVAIIYQGARIKLLIKLDQDFVLLNQFTVQNQSYDSLTIKSSNNSMTIVEKIHFLNQNLKVIKSTMHHSNKYAGTSFSSEIRIS